MAEAMAVFSQGDVERFGEIGARRRRGLALAGLSSVRGDYRGREAALQLLRGFHQLTAGRLTVKPMDILEGEEHLMSFTHVTAERR